MHVSDMATHSTIDIDKLQLILTSALTSSELLLFYAIFFSISSLFAEK